MKPIRVCAFCKAPLPKYALKQKTHCNKRCANLASEARRKGNNA